MKSTKSSAAARAAIATLMSLAACASTSGPKLAPLAPTAAASADVAHSRLVVDVTRLRNDRGLVGVSVFCGPDGFPGESTRACARARVPIAAGAAEAIFDRIPAGAFAVAVLHDEDADGRMATNWAGIPAEGYGASRDARRKFGAPRWEDARLELAQGEDRRVVIQVGY
jgi:uncharacterized protein (DUF2141 family)